MGCESRLGITFDSNYSFSMSFDLIETAVANTEFLKAARDQKPMDLELESFERLQSYCDREILKDFTVHRIIREPLGKYMLTKFMDTFLAGEKVDLLESMMFYIDPSTEKTHAKVARIFQDFLTKCSSSPQRVEDFIEECNFPSQSLPSGTRKDRKSTADETKDIFTQSAEIPRFNRVYKNPSNAADFPKQETFHIPTAFQSPLNRKSLIRPGDEYKELFDDSAMVDACFEQWVDRVKKKQPPPLNVLNTVKHALESEFATKWMPLFRKSELFQLYVRLHHRCSSIEVGYCDFQVFRILGKGAFGAVYAVVKKDTKKTYAMKEMDKCKIKYYKSERNALSERIILGKLTSPFVLNLKYAFANETSLFLIVDLCQGGDLQFHLLNAPDQRFSEERARFYAAEVVLALNSIHSLDYVYRDLKPGNVLLGDDGHIKVSDLGLAHKISPKRQLNHLAGTAGYWAPEVMKRENQTKAVDWWSFGVFLHKMLTGHKPVCECKEGMWCPFGTDKDHEVLAKKGIEMTFRLDLDERLSVNAKSILSQLLQPDVSNRLGSVHGAREVKEHAFFSDIDWNRLEDKLIDPPYVPQKGAIHAALVSELDEEGPDAALYSGLEFNEEDKAFHERFCSNNEIAAQQEILWAIDRNENIKLSSLELTREERGCCVIT